MRISNAYKLLFLIVMQVALCPSLPAEEIPVLNDVKVDSFCSFDEAMGVYHYRYEIVNPSANSGKILMVELDISRPPATQDLSAEGLMLIIGVDPYGDTISRSFDSEIFRKSAVMKKGVIPIGVKPPKGWSVGISVRGTSLWGSNAKENMIIPGQLLEGFEISSRGIPAIRDITMHPDWIYTVEDSVSEEDSERSKQIKEQIAFHTRTVGPTAPPKDLNYQDFLDSIIAMKHEAYALGWITSEGVEKSLDAKLDGAKKKLLAGSFVPARKMLDAFVNEVEAQGCESYDNCPKGKHLKPEAYALLKYNALYLIEHLK